MKINVTRKIGAILFIIFVSAMPIILTLINIINHYVLKNSYNFLDGKYYIIGVFGVIGILGLVPKVRDELFVENFLKSATIGFFISIIGLAAVIFIYAIGLNINLLSLLICLYIAVAVSFVIALIYHEKRGV
ncbi:MAG: hypothetical protein Q8942_13185 [Bacillota bacterium]|nr:hypothetical protein [Bacillota bacterium]